MKNIHWFLILLIASLPSFLVISLKAGLIHNELLETLFIHDDSLDQINALGSLAIWFVGSLTIALYLDAKTNFDIKK